MGLTPMGCCDGSRKDKNRKYLTPKKEDQQFQKCLHEFQKEPGTHEIFVARQPVKLRAVQECCSLNTAVQLFIYKIEFITWLNEYYSLTLQFQSKKNQIMKVWMQFLALLRNGKQTASTAGFIEFFANHSSKKFPIGVEVETPELFTEMLAELISCEDSFQEKVLKGLFVFESSFNFDCYQCNRSFSVEKATYGLEKVKWVEEGLEETIKKHLKKKMNELGVCSECGSGDSYATSCNYATPHYFFITLRDLASVPFKSIWEMKGLLIGGKLYSICEAVIFKNDSAIKGHYILLRHFVNQGWRIIDSETVEPFATNDLYNDFFMVKMIVLEQH